MKIAILATGNEVVDGETLNTNAQKFAYDLSSNGLKVITHLSCRDVLEEMTAALTFLADHDIIITIGGLGPTCDDITRFAVAKHVNLPLIEHQKARDHLINFKKKEVNINIENRRQEALFPESAVLLDNENGTALGAWIKHNNKSIIMLPGPPRECMPMWKNQILPELMLNTKEQAWRRWLVFDTPESVLSVNLEAMLAGKNYDLGFRCSTPYVEVKLKADSTTEALINNYLHSQQLLGQQFASNVLKKQLLTTNISLSIKDNLTGGLLESWLMEPDLYKKVSFHEEREIHVNLSGLHDFWHKIEPMEHLTCFLQIGDYLQKYAPSSRSKNLPLYAKEWAAYAIIKYLDGN